MPDPSDTARIQLSWSRRQWLKFAAFVEDHPKTTVATVVLLVSFILFYGIRLKGFAHFSESGARWRLETFGGSHRFDRSVRVPDIVLSFQRFQCDQLDITVPTAAHLGGTAFRKELREIAAEKDGRIRVAALDPRLSEVGHLHHERFAELSEVFGMRPWEFRARCWHSTAVLIHLGEELGEAIEIRLISEPSPDAVEPYFVIGRSGHAYRAAKPEKRLDTIVPRPAEPTGSDSFTHPGTVHMNRPKHPDVVKFSEAFATLWQKATPLTPELKDELLIQLRGQITR